jgi:hypothetical protein
VYRLLTVGYVVVTQATFRCDIETPSELTLQVTKNTISLSYFNFCNSHPLYAEGIIGGVREKIVRFIFMVIYNFDK